MNGHMNLIEGACVGYWRSAVAVTGQTGLVQRGCLLLSFMPGTVPNIGSEANDNS
jgi:hypothetical protein